MAVEYPITYVANLLAVGSEALKKHIRELWPEKMKNGVITMLNEEEVTMIKKRMIPTTQVVAVSTELEMVEKTRDVMYWLTEKVKELSEKGKVYDQIADSSGLKSIQEMANILGIGVNNFFKMLRDDGIFYKTNGINIPKTEYRKYFVTKEEPYHIGEESRVYTRIFATPEGELWLARKYAREV